MQDAVRDQFISAAQRFRKMDACALSNGRLHFGEMVVMENIAGQCGARCEVLDIPQITKRLHVSKPAVSQILNSLERKGCIIRQINPNDRRRIAVSATPKGQEYWHQSREGYERFMDSMLERFGSEEMARFIGLMDRFNTVYDQILSENEE